MKVNPLLRPESPEALSSQRRDERTEAMIAEHGWEVQGVENANGWVYTVGLVGKGHPELVLQGVDPHELACTVLNKLARRMVERGRDLEPGETVTVLDGGYVVSDRTPLPRQLPQAVRWWGDRLRALEVRPVLSDEPAAQDT